ncbi:hypothetical protein [Brevibacillus parabrevis]|uniref:Uncharacterized protein n=1 Tax=Brevibacillus parabrevis TaxID=54914 RepID=A0A4Y3PFL3_BREPA|nr:hypothetical protein [Brevibacillus parabrevis]RNB93835.1 hypothetical protein EDM60_20150 [Brevibacillus parabrevis]GEB33272.1 hypothetical protein BPA01_28520 [Brevibacillus parabrevis]
MTTKEAKRQRFWNGIAIVLYGVLLPLCCLLMVVGETIPYPLLLVWFALPYIEQSGMEYARRKEVKW